MLRNVRRSQSFLWTDMRSGTSHDILGVTSAVYIDKAKRKEQQKMWLRVS